MVWVYLDVNFLNPKHLSKRTISYIHSDARYRLASLRPTYVKLYHCIFFIFQKWNFYIQFWIAIYYTAILHLIRITNPSKCTPTELDVIEYLLNTGLVLKLVHADSIVEINTNDNMIFTFELHNFYFTLFHKKECDVLIEISLHKTDCTKNKIMTFTFNDIKIESTNEMLNILSSLASWVVHPLIHAHFNQLYCKCNGKLILFPNSKHETKKHARRIEVMIDADDMLIHGQYLNAVAHYYPSLYYNIRPRWGQQVLTHNSIHISLEYHESTLDILTKYSKYVKFLVKSRQILRKLCEKYGVSKYVDPDIIFSTSILHSTDHSQQFIRSKYLYLNNDKLPNFGFFNLANCMFQNPSQYLHTNLLKDKLHKNSFYWEFYTEIFRLDPDLANVVTLSISY